MDVRDVKTYFAGLAAARRVDPDAFAGLLDQLDKGAVYALAWEYSRTAIAHDPRGADQLQALADAARRPA